MEGEIFWAILDTTLYIAGNDTGVLTKWVQQGGDEKPPWYDNRASITSVVIDAPTKPISCRGWFFGMTNLTSISNLGNLQTIYSTSMYGMFYDCVNLNLANLNLNLLDVSRIQNFKACFGCSNGANPVTSSAINLSSWNTQSATTMESMFQNQVNIVGISQSFNMSNVTNTSYMFTSCQSMTNLAVSGWNVGNVTNMYRMFDDCTSLASPLVVNNWNVGKVQNMSEVFRKCSSLTYLSLNNWNVSNVTTFERLFSGCTSLSNVGSLTNWDTSKATDMAGMFAGCPISSFGIINNWNVSNVRTMETMFDQTGITSLNLSNWNVSNVTDMHDMFAQCTDLTSLTVDAWDTRNLTNCYQIFGRCTSLASIDIANWDTSKVTDCHNMFYQDTALTRIYVSKDLCQNATDSTGMFYNCTSLVGGNGTQYNSSYQDKARAIIDKVGRVGYLTQATRNVTVSHNSGGTITGNGTYNYGSQVTITSTPSTNYYFNKLSEASLGVVADEDTILSNEYKINITKNLSFTATFTQRQSHTLSLVAPDGYTTIGAGTYKYLDQPIAQLVTGTGFVIFDGWYLNNDLVSTENPYKFKMPDSNLSLTARIGSEIFGNADVRQFALQNGKGEVYQLTSKNSKIFLNEPQNLGLSKSLTTTRLGTAEEVSNQKINMPQPTGTLIFYKDKNSGKYEDYYNFVRFLSKQPITLWYRLPTSLDNTVFHIPVEIINLGKSEVGREGVMTCPITFYGLRFWQVTQISVEATANTIEIYNEGDNEVGILLDVAKSNSGTFNNPKVIFSDEDGAYGQIAFDIDGITRIVVNTKDTEQGIFLYNGNSLITNPIEYIDFGYADGQLQFPFPKLKQGHTTVQFTYDGDNSDNKSYIANYDEEFISV